MPSHNISRYTDAEAQTTVKANVKLNELQPPDGTVAMNAQKLAGLGAGTVQDDSLRKGRAEITLADLVAAVCSETEADNKIAIRVPSGLIIMWHGTIANIPSGWVICDGNNSTPNLLTRFIEGVASAATDPGATGGATSKSHASHYHSNPNTAGSTVTETIPAGDAYYEYPAKDGHTHSQGNTGGTTVSSHSDIRPKYYDVAFLMKT